MRCSSGTLPAITAVAIPIACPVKLIGHPDEIRETSAWRGSA
jgi:hypothetical protein